VRLQVIAPKEAGRDFGIPDIEREQHERYKE
jgi:hypothetical protein